MISLEAVYEEALAHREQHRCGGYPYQQGSMLTALAAALAPQKILELGTGLGYAVACFAIGSPDSMIETIDQDETHIAKARSYWEQLELNNNISTFHGKAEAILPEKTDLYDIIFFDGYAPSLKFLVHFERLLKVNGMLITANLFVKDPLGGRYVRQLQNTQKWTTGFFADTALSVKLR